MAGRITGRYERVVAGGEEVAAFVPFPLPPREPALAIDDRIGERLRAAEVALARLDLAGEIVPSLDWFLYAFVRKEAVISSQIEGTQATLVDLLTFEAKHDTAPDADVEEVCNYLAALSFARAEFAKADGLPLSMRLLNEAHRRLMHGTRGAGSQPGEVRRSQNWIGGSRPGNAVHVPPPPHVLLDLLGDLEKHLHVDDGLAPLVRAGLAHVQFETIHPYLDGNGRIGRLLIALLLEHWGLLKTPMLYISLFFKRHREDYYRRLNSVRTDGDWEGWTDFFLDGVATIADEAVASARELFAIVMTDRARVLAQDTTTVSAARLFEFLPNHPIITVAAAMRLIDTSKPTATRAIETLVATGILIETTGKKRDRSFAYQAYIDRLQIGTELKRK
jgi:Fic family protein